MGITIKFELNVYVNRGDAMNCGIVKAKSCGMFLKTAAKEIGRLKDSLSYSTLENYKTALRALKQYLKQDVRIDTD